MAVRTMQVVLGSGATPVVSVSTPCRWMTFQDNDAGDMRVGDADVSMTRGAKLSAGGGSYHVTHCGDGVAMDLKGWYAAGAQGQVLDVIYDE